MSRVISKRGRVIAWILLITGFVLVNGLIFSFQGIRRGGDSIRYESGGQNILKGEPFEGKQLSYIGYISLVALSHWLGVGVGGVVAVQIVLSGMAALALFDLGRNLYGSRAGFLATALFVFNPVIAQWNIYILTDSLYISAVIITTWLIFKSGIRKGIWFLAAALGILITISVRPNGWVFLPLAGLYWAAVVISRKVLRWLVIIITIAIPIAAYVMTPELKSGFAGGDPYQMLIRGEVVWGYEGWRQSMPPAGETDDTGGVAIMQYVFQHPLASLRLAAYRLGASLIYLRPYHSLLRNLLAFVIIVPQYLLAAICFFRCRRDVGVLFLGSVIIAHLFIVTLSFADWDGRFLLYVLPLIGVISACGVERIISSFARIPRES